jgi:aminoglycoside/choline kinase family phosphotransferase
MVFVWVFFMEQIVKKIFKEKLNLEVSKIEITKLFGHASYRTYYRATLPDKTTYVIMQMPPGASSVSEEITNYQGSKEELPYLNIQRYLKGLGLPVPEVYAWVPEENLLVLEDVGDRHLEGYVKEASEVMRLPFYKRAIDLLVELQKKTEKKGDCIAFHRSFDETLLNWELDHFLEFGIEDRFQIKISEEEKKTFVQFTREVSKTIAQSPYRFVHRDFQSRNLMLKDYNLYLLDFQDALLGPEPYDLVSLLRDSYVELSWRVVDSLIGYYLQTRAKQGIPVQSEKEFRRLFDLVTLQRKLKDTGRFQFIHSVKGNSNFLVSVPASLRYVGEAFSHLPELDKLREWIGKYVKELM